MPVGAAEPAPIKVDIWSDVVCPWCYIGKRRFEAALAAYDGPVEVEYHSFELSPDIPADYEGTHDEMLAAKGFPREQLAQMRERVSSIAESVGLRYDYERMQPANTVRAHELMHYAKAHGKQLETKERLMRAYFTEGRHVGRVEELVELAAEVGLDPDGARRALESEEYLPAVRADQAQAAEYGIRGVPFFVFDGKYGVSGAQETATFANVLEQLGVEKEVSR